MTLQEIYDLAIKMGIEADPRGGKRVKQLLQKRQEEFKDLTGKKKIFFDTESLINPYSDSRILNGNPKTAIRKLLVGIDAEASEVLLFDRLNQAGAKIDLLVSHHPSGHALASLHEVMEVQVDMFAEAQVPVNVAHSLFQTRIGEVQRRFSPLNHGHTIDAAKLLSVPLLSIHTVWDNMGHKFVVGYLNNKEFANLEELYDEILKIPEFTEAAKGKNPPIIVSGSEKSRVGRIAVGYTGGTSPSKELYIELAKAGVGTIVEMHMPEESVQELKKMHVNVIDCGHMAADSIGANLFLDALEKKGVEVVPCSGLIRIRRQKYA
ncbi:NGG1p interacting factor NIF3 [Candidatus Daviesbacteria bacterium]|nr:NGG1p interacting factor NIF3 [Candidatus Daviesbacteria bacterium]